MGQRLRMADLARLAGVSVSTVSRALGDHPQIPAEKRREISRLAEQHGYVTNMGARRLRLSRTDTIAVAFPLGHERDQGISDPFFLALLGHLADEITERGYDLLLTRAAAPRSDWLPRLMRSGRADGLLVVGQSDQHDALNAAGGHFAPFVVWGAELPGQTYCTVGVDNAAGARAAAEHLIARGGRRLAFFGCAPVPELSARLRGVREAVAAHDLSLPPDRVIATHSLGSAAERAVRERVRNGVDFDAVVCATDVIALAAIKVLQDEGCRVPDDVMVTGFDDLAIAASASPPLTSVRQDLRAGAQIMVDLLFRGLAGERLSSVQLPAELIVRQSTGG